MKLRRNNPGIRYLIDFWSRYCPLESWHIEWARAHIKVYSSLKKGHPLYLEGERQKYVYLVTKGILARVVYHPKIERRKILSIAHPGMAMMTTDHLYSDTPSKGDIIVLRPNTVVVQIAYRSIKTLKEVEPRIDTLIDVLGNKKKKQMMALHRMMHEQDPFRRYLLFAKEMPEIQKSLTQVEQAELLGVGRSTVQRAQFFLLTGQRPKN